MNLVDTLWPPGSPEAKRLHDAFRLYATQARFDRWMDRCEKGLDFARRLKRAFPLAHMGRA